MKAPATYAHLPSTVTTALESGDAAGEVRTPALDVTSMHAEHADLVWRSLQRLGVREADLEDMLQEVFVVVHRRIHTLQPDAHVVSWLFGICTRIAAAYRRRSYVRREEPVAGVPEEGVLPTADPRDRQDAPDPEEVAATRQARARLDALLDEMDLEKRAVFVMFEIDELECDEIAVILGVPIGTIYSRLHAARKAFDKALARLRAREAHAAQSIRSAAFERARGAASERGGAR